MTISTEYSTAISARGICKSFGTGEARLTVFNNFNIDIADGQFTAIMGPSGSGKSTLMHILAGLDSPDSGFVTLAGRTITDISDAALTKIRRNHMGFVFQAFNLIPAMTADENIMLPSKLARTNVDPQFKHAIVDNLGLSDRLTHRPHELSGGQQQRVAVARALVNQPDVIFADEPTGALDTRSGTEVLQTLRTCVSELGQTVVMVTHDPAAAAYADRVVMLADGYIVGELYSPTVEAISQALLEVTK
ncbi:ABC transporter ATP-binding protein [Brevibacterium sp. Marseille-P9724]|uniref:ABC transporter ATP-binding protein n=1 Tax=Brevibacterium sp. Marseille-P9724 TaxID=2614125 RepID=UPI00126001D7|nr:ABC transporter ATP-binding protein [Brevibacterium sp. Marseille-P9724]